MELKPGYKLTEVGVIPEDWDAKLLCSIAEIRSGIAKNSKIAVSEPILVHYLRVANVQDGFLDITEMYKIEVSRNDLKRYAVLPGDVLMNEGGDLDKLGRGSIWRGEFNPCIHQNHVFVVRSRSSLFPEYLNKWTSGNFARRYFLIAGKQTTNLATINKTALGQLPVALPPLPEQRSIATALSDMDELLGACDRLIAKKRDLKQATMQQLLTGKTRLTGFGEGKGYQKTEVGEIPEDWEVKKLASVVNYKNGAAHEQRIHDSGKFVVVNSKFISTEGLTRKYSDDCFCPAAKDDVLMVMSDVPNGKAIAKCFWVETNNLYTVNQRICVLSPRNINGKLLFYKLDRNPFYLQFDDGVKQTNLRKSEVLSCPLGLPKSETEQNAIATVLSDMDAEIAALEQRRDKTRALKQAMMQELLTGRIRLA